MHLGVNLLHHGAVPLARAAEDAGYRIVLAPEGYRSDAPSVLGAVAGATDGILLASGVMQIPARPAILTALTAMTLHTLSGGRFRLGLGVSNPDISESWYGVPFDRPLSRTAQYVRVVRAAISGEGMAAATDPERTDGTGAVRLPLAPAAPGAVPVYLAAGGPGNLRLTGRVADGWIGMFSSPEQTTASIAAIDAGAAAADRDIAGFDYLVCAPAFVHDDPALAADRLRGHYAHLLTVGGPGRNIYVRLARGMGYGAELDALYKYVAAGDRVAAAKAVPQGFIDATALIGPPSRIAERLAAYREAGATTVSAMVSSADADTTERIATIRAIGKAWHA
ncbi:luciferase family protein [Catenulispora acidiphila DSM 44928]|uniref:Luciferase family protein n=1 Tax=Catenulispora acidiphila (strain DSM 44928 / JCM 14897 / NBRC 102108 / NRRL B-24433 / ID139908) TaxID=479433 RepID=C7PWR1_CATAD|nr:LLM class flavin-dependent oxidoreductase [Catenulispora acidiphila]ACU75341.1 luciferase family protein [Catenulispora acidiphila DSM 44928]